MPAPTPNIALESAITQIRYICDESEGRSQFFPYGGSGYKASITHYFESSTEVAGCAVQPGSVADLQSIVKVIAETRVPFAVKCGGHATNPGFSSVGENGIQIYLLRMNQIDIDAEKKLVRVGAGCLFEELYQALDPYDINIVGGSGLSGVGVTGWMLGGGYSVKTSQHGLGVDNLAAVKVVLPNGEFVEASDTTNQDLFFALKGGCNNFGIITEFTLIAHDQGEFHDFTLTFRDHFPEVKAAILRILVKQDNKANVETAFRHYSEPGAVNPEVMLTVHCVYDGTYPAEDPFAELKKLQQEDNESVPSPLGPRPSSYLLADLRRSYHNGTYDILSELPDDVKVADIPFEDRPKPPMPGISQFPRGRWGNVVVDEFTPGIIDEIERLSYECAKNMSQHGGTRISIGFWPFTSAMFDNATNSAWPHVQGKPNCPIIVYFTWENKKNDTHWIDTMKETLSILRTRVVEERPASKDLPYFINTAFKEATGVEDLYRDNLDELKRLRTKYDQNGVMDLTGGFRIPRA